MLTCEACKRPGVYREDYDAVLCDTHAGVPSYAPPRVSLFERLARFFRWSCCTRQCWRWASAYRWRRSRPSIAISNISLGSWSNCRCI